MTLNASGPHAGRVTVEDAWHAAWQSRPDAERAAALLGVEGSAGQRRRHRALAIVGRPRRLVSVLAAARQLPVIRIQLSNSREARNIYSIHRRHSAPFLRGFGRTIAIVPDAGSPFPGGNGRRYHRQIRAAVREGLTISEVTVEVANRVLAALGRDLLPDPRCPGTSFVVTDGLGAPVAVTHVHVDGEVAELRLAVHAADHPLTGAARYAVYDHTIGFLRQRGVRVLIHLDNFFTMSAGLREFQRRLGLTPVHLLITRPRSRQDVNPRVRTWGGQPVGVRSAVGVQSGESGGGRPFRRYATRR